MMGFHGYSISDIFDLCERHFGGVHHCFALIQRCTTAYIGREAWCPRRHLEPPGWIGSSATVRLCRHGPFQDSVSADCPDGIVRDWSQVFNGCSTSASSRRRTAYLILGISKAIFGKTRYGEGPRSGGLWIIDIYEMTTPGFPRSTILGGVALGCRLVSVADEGWAVLRTGLSPRWPSEDPRAHEGNKHKKLAKLFSFFLVLMI